MNEIEKSRIGKICTLHSEIEGDIMSVLSKSILLGELLSQQKDSLKHGEWIPWVESNLPFKRVQAAKYIRVFANRELLNEQSTVHLEGAIDSLAKPKPAHVAQNSGNNEWYTPPTFIEAAKEVMGDIDTDPASSEIANVTVQAKQIYTKDDDGLDKEWGKIVWINPPYSQPEIGQFCDALLSRLDSGEVKEACALVNNATETVFGQKLLSVCNAACFPSGRIKFLDTQGDAKGAPLQGQMVLYFGPQSVRFIENFSTFGVCLYG